MSAPIEIPAWVKAIALLAIFGAGVAVGHSYSDAVWAKKWADRNAEEANGSREASEQAREVEQNDKAEADKAANQYRKEEQDGQATTDSTIAGIHDGSIRVRERFTCPPATPAPKANTSPGVVDDPGAGGLRGKDAEFLIRFAGECRDNATKLNYLQREVERLLRTCQK